MRTAFPKKEKHQTASGDIAGFHNTAHEEAITAMKGRTVYTGAVTYPSSQGKGKSPKRCQNSLELLRRRQRHTHKKNQLP